MLLRGALLLVLAPAALALTLPSDLTVEATQPGGAVVTYATSTNGIGDDFNGRPLGHVTCAPLSGSLFPLGTTNVQCHDNAGATASFHVTITDTTAPVIHAPRHISVQSPSDNGVTVSYQTAAIDVVDGSVAVACSPASGALFAVGETVVRCAAHDARGNHTATEFVVRVLAPQPPPDTPPADVTKEATGPDGAVVTFNASSGHGSGEDVGYGSDHNGRPLGDGANCAPASGSTFPLGVTTVHCGSVSFKVTVVDTTPPALTTPANLTFEATSAAGANVLFSVTAHDLVDGGVDVACTPASNTTFGFGKTTVACSASDARGNSGHGTFEVTVVDTTAPALTLPANITTQDPVVHYHATAHDSVDGNIAIACAPPSGSTFASGTTTVHCNASDSRGNSASGEFFVTVNDAADTEAPVIVAINATPNVLSPPNKKMIAVTLTIEVTDDSDPAPLVRIFDVTADESIDASDTSITGLLTIDLRADRAGNGDGRVYTIWVEAIDASGNRSVSSVTVTVPHDSSPSTAPAPPATKKRSVRRG